MYEYITIFVHNTYALIHKSKEYTSKKNRSFYVIQTSLEKSFHMGTLAGLGRWRKGKGCEESKDSA
jgi:hypothetical protein